MVITAMRSCFPEFRAARASRLKSASAFVVQDEPNDMSEELGDAEAPGTVTFDELEAFLAEHGVQEAGPSSADHFEEEEVAEVLAATWKEKRTEISRLQKARRFSQASDVKQRFSKEKNDRGVEDATRSVIGHETAPPR